MKRKRSKKRKKPNPREVTRDLPGVHHIGPSGIPSELVEEFDHAYRTIAIARSGLTATQWRLLGKLDYVSDARMQAIVKLPGLIIDAMNESIIKRHCPPCESSCDFDSRQRLEVTWNRVTSAEIKKKLIYHWPERPTIPINGGNYVAGFSVHSMLRMLERLDLESNRGRMNLARAMKCTDIEVDGQGFWIWTPIGTNGRAAEAVKSLIGTTQPEMYRMRIAYCPVEFLGKFAVASTALHPAMKVSGINANLVAFKNVFEQSERALSELRQLHERLPMVRRMRGSSNKKSVSPITRAVQKAQNPVGYHRAVKKMGLDDGGDDD